MQAGRPGTVTIATNMAGRGTDIVLGGNLAAERARLENPDEATLAQLQDDWASRNAKVIEMGGLHIIGTERHESRRIDNQLRGRSGRQGDPGSSRFYLSMEDNLMRIFGDPERVKRLLSRAGMKEDEAIESKMLSRQIERAQRKVEAHNFDIRKQLLEYDDVANDQRKVVYQQRTELMEAEEIGDAIKGIRAEVVNRVIDEHVPPQSAEELWDKDGLTKAIERDFGARLEVAKLLEEDTALDEAGLRRSVLEHIENDYAQKEQQIGPKLMRELEKGIMLRQLDAHWKDHIAGLDYLRQGIHLRGYAQRNPKQEYKREAFDMFSAMLDRMKHDTISILSKVQIRKPEDVEAVEAPPPDLRQMRFQHAAAPSIVAAPPPPAAGAPDPLTGAGPVRGKRMPLPTPPQDAEPVTPYVREQPKVGRNEPCPCGTGKKYKHCHGKLA
jgi:preprotein translocase subunit SecA